MEKLAILDIFTGRDRYYLPLMEVLGPKRVVFYCRRNNVGSERQSVSLHSMEGTLAKIRQLGIEVVLDDEDYTRAQKHTYFLMDYYHRRMRGTHLNMPAFDRALGIMEAQKKRFHLLHPFHRHQPDSRGAGPGRLFFGSQ